MKLKAVVEKLDEVDAKYHELYEEKNGKWELTGVEGMRTEADVTRLQSALTKERNDHKAAKESLKKFEGLDPDDVREKLDKIPELEEAAKGKLDEAKINELVEKRVTSRVATAEREKKKLETDLQNANKTIEDFQKRERTGKITEAVRAAATKAQLVPSAIEDAIILSERVLEIDETGNISVKANSGFTEGVGVDVLFTELKEKRPHWWPASSGGGSRGGSGGSGGDNPWTAANWNLTKQGEILRTDRARAEQMAKSAGTSIGGPKPAK